MLFLQGLQQRRRYHLSKHGKRVRSAKQKTSKSSHKKLSSITSWENSRKASVEAELKKIEEQLEKKKAEYTEKMKNKIAMIHKEAEEKKFSGKVSWMFLVYDFSEHLRILFGKLT
ncbi:hypothetical protein OIU78_030388 [Salix suchowensis]|nr:hypothetical protein OIU78_030388 [Salix suchowensis]